ncbi:MAG TPA: hypothetical protein VLL25_12965 [Acidimicrobiales bacterium]|nr:hypothetical protein [Acidimicrobiales bacterium]
MTDTGNLTIARVLVSDDVLRPIACPRDRLGPGESETCTKTQIARWPTRQYRYRDRTAARQDGQRLGLELCASDRPVYVGTEGSALDGDHNFAPQ